MSDKRTTLDEAIAHIESGMTIGIGGWGSRRKPMAFVRALLRTGVTDLTVVTYGGPDIGLLGRLDAVSLACGGGDWRRRVRHGGKPERRHGRHDEQAGDGTEMEVVYAQRHLEESSRCWAAPAVRRGGATSIERPKSRRGRALFGSRPASLFPSCTPHYGAASVVRCVLRSLKPRRASDQALFLLLRIGVWKSLFQPATKGRNSTHEIEPSSVPTRRGLMRIFAYRAQSVPPADHIFSSFPPAHEGEWHWWPEESR